jgi:hypothetical protein
MIIGYVQKNAQIIVYEWNEVATGDFFNKKVRQKTILIKFQQKSQAKNYFDKIPTKKSGKTNLLELC